MLSTGVATQSKQAHVLCAPQLWDDPVTANINTVSTEGECDVDQKVSVMEETVQEQCHQQAGVKGCSCEMHCE